MDPILPNQLPSVRTFARDQEKKRASGAILTEVTKKATPPKVTEPVPENPEDRKYQAPTWIGNKNKPVPKTETPKDPVVIESTPATEKKAETLQPIKAPKPKPAAEADIVVKVDNEDAATATIIRDTKKNRFRLFPAVFTSIGTWFKEQKRKREIRKIPKYTVPDATRRKGVIQKATSHTGKDASFDYATIQERIKQRQERVAPKKPGFVWTPNTEPSQPLLEAPEIVVVPKAPTITNIKIVPRKSVSTVKHAPLPPVPPKAPIQENDEIKLPLPAHLQPAKETLPVQPTVPQVAEVAVPKIVTPLVVVAPAPAVPPPAPAISTAPEVTYATEPVSSPEPTTKEITIPEPEKTQGRRSLRSLLFTVNTNTVAMALAGLIVATGIFGIVVFLSFSGDDATINVTVSTPNHPSVIEAPLQLLAITEPITKEILTETVQKNNQANTLDVLQALIVTEATGQNVLPPPTIINALDFDIDSAFIQSISYIYFGTLTTTEPFILMKITDANTARGSMLVWEEALYTDTAQILKKTTALDTSAITTAVFSDAILDREDVRILKTLAGTELLVYGIVDRDTVIITTSSSAFSALQAIKK